MKTIHFNRTNMDENEFYRDLNKRVKGFLKENNLAQKGGREIMTKAIILLTSFFALKLLIYTNPMHWIFVLILYYVLGRVMASIGMGVMHDASHGTFSNTPWVNTLMAATIMLFAGTTFNWRVQHVMKHHNHTNVDHYDEDTDAGVFLRLTKSQEWKWYHVIQRYPFIVKTLYSLLTIKWAIFSDFKQAKTYLKEDIDKYPSRVSVYARIILAKLFLVWFWIILPISLDMNWKLVLSGCVVMHLACGKRLATVFQLAHINSSAKTFPETNAFNHHRIIHQFETTSNFGTDNAFLSWETGGLNHQIEHHVFPNIVSTNYPKIGKLVKQICYEYGVTYNLYNSMRDAENEHFKQLNTLSYKAA